MVEWKIVFDKMKLLTEVIMDYKILWIALEIWIAYCYLNELKGFTERKITAEDVFERMLMLQQAEKEGKLSEHFEEYI